MDTFQQHHNMQSGARKDDIISVDEFVEYYNNISCNIENDQYFDLMITNAWNLDGGNNPANMPYAGSKKKIANVSSKDAYRQDHHRNLFGTDDTSPFAKDGGQWQTSNRTATSGAEIFPGKGAGGGQLANPRTEKMN